MLLLEEEKPQPVNVFHSCFCHDSDNTDLVTFSLLDQEPPLKIGTPSLTLTFQLMSVRVVLITPVCPSVYFTQATVTDQGGGGGWGFKSR